MCGNGVLDALKCRLQRSVQDRIFFRLDCHDLDFVRIPAGNRRDATGCDLRPGANAGLLVHELTDAVGAEADEATDVGAGQAATDQVVHVAG